MRIDELDEFQGVTPRLVTDWLIANGWTQTKPRWWERGEHGFLFDADTFDQPWFWTHALAAIYTAGNVQALLSRINPRMRGPGYPSYEAAKAHGHDGWWLFQHPDGELHIAQAKLPKEWNEARFYWERGLMGEPCDEECSWWPCDKNGSKVRWPTDAQGNML
jgi:hypothetical protein